MRFKWPKNSKKRSSISLLVLLSVLHIPLFQNCSGGFKTDEQQFQVIAGRQTVEHPGPAPTPTPSPSPSPSPTPTPALKCTGNTWYNPRINGCSPLSRDCAINYGTGIEYWTGSVWSSCYVKSCWSGYTIDVGNNVCRSPRQVSLGVSATRITAGDTVALTWSGGPSAHRCTIYLSDVSRTNYQPWGLLASSGRVSAQLSINTSFNLICLDAAGNYLANNATAYVNVDNDPKNKDVVSYLSRLGQHRSDLWARTTGDWEVWYDGLYDPLYGQAPAYWWDNPIDDDWDEPWVVAYGFAFNKPSPGYFLVDRTTRPSDWHKGGVISRRDEFLNSFYGVTVEFRAKIYPDSGIYDGSDHNAFSLHYMNEGKVTASFFLTPTHLKVGGRYLAPEKEVQFDTTDFNTYRFVQDPNSTRFRIYVNDSPQPILEGDAGASQPPNSVTDLEHPTIIIGGEGVLRSHFILDYVRYRRGAYAPGALLPTPVLRPPVPLPEPLPLHVREQFIPGFDSTHFYSDPYAIFGAMDLVPSFTGYKITRGCSAGWKKASDGSMEYSAASQAPPTCILPALPGIRGRGDVTIEMRLKVLPDSGERGFSLMYSDEMGTTGVVFSKNKVETVLGIKNIGYQTLYRDLSSGYHTFRLVRPAHQLYSFLYVDNNPIPEIIDAHPDGSTGMTLLSTNGLLEFGYAWNPGRNPGHVLIDYIRWAPSAWAPPLPAPK